MIHYLEGEIVLKDNKKLVLENQGIGFEIFCALKNLKKLPVGKKLKIYTILHFSKEVIKSYGFLNEKELEVFKVLNDIPGIGPKTAMDLASLGSLEKIKEILEKGEIPLGIKGIGRKKLQKILLELTGKIEEISKGKYSQNSEALGALVSLGFSSNVAREVLSKIPKEIEGTEQKIKEALKILGK